MDWKVRLTPRKCASCGKEFMGRGRQKWCGDCGDVFTGKKQRRYTAKNWLVNWRDDGEKKSEGND